MLTVVPVIPASDSNVRWSVPVMRRKHASENPTSLHSIATAFNDSVFKNSLRLNT
jgi:hypothetical protein